MLTLSPWCRFGAKYIFYRIPSAPQFDRSSKPDYRDYSSNSVVKGGLRTVVVPSKVMTHFLNLAMKNTLSNIETCGILAGKLVRIICYSLLVTLFVLLF